MSRTTKDRSKPGIVPLCRRHGPGVLKEQTKLKERRSSQTAILEGLNDDSQHMIEQEAEDHVDENKHDVEAREGEWAKLESEEPEYPIVVTLKWHCGLAISGPKWQGVDAYECDECPAEGEIAMPFDDLEFDPPVEDPPAELIGVNMPVYCTSCGQEFEELFHFDEDSVKTAIKKFESVTKRRAELSRASAS